MENAQDDKYWYLSGEAKRGAIESDLKAQLRALQEETDKKFNKLHTELVNDDAVFIANVLNESLNKSVKPGVKTKIKKKKVEVSKKAFAVGACAFMIAGGLATVTSINIVKNVSTSIKENQVIREEVGDFRTEYVTLSTHYNYVTNAETLETEPIHWHDYTDIVMNAKQANEDPIIAFYMVYTSLDDYCRSEKINTIIETYNRFYGTDYSSLNDFLLKNHFATQQEWKTYVANTLMEQEAIRNGSNNLGR